MDGIIDVLSGSRLSNKEEPLETFRNLVKHVDFSVLLLVKTSLYVFIKLKTQVGYITTHCFYVKYSSTKLRNLLKQNIYALALRENIYSQIFFLFFFVIHFFFCLLHKQITS